METSEGPQVIAFADATAFEAWLEAHHTLHEGIWMKIAKKASGIASVTAPEALDVCLCYGWIDGQRKALDATHFLQRYTPRRPRSLWSAVNIRKVEALTAAGRMRPPGLAAVAAAQADGRWEAAYASIAEATVPPDLDAALDANPAARAFFDTLDRTSRYAVLWPLMTARTPATRTARLTRMIDTLAEGRRV
ncbi:YdeI family protein [Streptomyces sp. NPDC060194]|uniref:YdeI/OmpD-associated family protein n=1 Tax=Streptomyces sp. NPDC060194 TaxID=3347069 RepID=UPI003657AF71